MEVDWGKDKANAYYLEWENLPNGQVNESDYMDLFLTSDAMILDSGSFLNEYLCVNKPSLHLMRDKNLSAQFNEFGKKAFALHYHGESEDDVRKFISDIVIEGNDSLMHKRVEFVSVNLKPPNSGSASYNIYSFIANSLELKKKES